MFKFVHRYYGIDSPRLLRMYVERKWPTLNGVDFPAERHESEEAALTWLKVNSPVNHRATALRVNGLSGWVVGGCIKERTS